MSSIRVAIALAAVLALGALGASAQQVTPSTSHESIAAQATSVGEVNSDHPVLQQRNPRYKIQPQDALTISFPISPEFDQKVVVQPDGFINLQGAGGLHVEGMSVPELVEAIKVAYSKILHDPLVDVDLTDFQKPFFVVSGQVTKPGQYDLRSDTTILDAIAIAGGLQPTAKTQILFYRRVSPGLVEVKRINLKAMLNGKNVNEDPEMHPGDMIFVPEKFITNFRKYIPYSLGMYFDPVSAIF